MAGKLFRIGHMGDLSDLMLLTAIAGCEMAMCDLGISIELGSGVAAAQEHYRPPARIHIPISPESSLTGSSGLYPIAPPSRAPVSYFDKLRQ